MDRPVSTRSRKPVSPFVLRLVVRLSVGAALALVALALPQAVQACCTAVPCAYCINSSNDCVCGNNMPVCNMAGCNCNVQCGMNSFGTDLKCYFHPTCNGAANADARKRFDDIDADHDGKINSVELAGWLQKNKVDVVKAAKAGLPAELKGKGAKDVIGYEFGKMDADKDGFIAPAELDSSLAPATK